MSKGKINYDIVLAAYIICYFIISIYTLTDFPFVHSDEAWLSGLTRNMMDTGNLAATETFYNLSPRFPHAIKTIFHLLQMPFLMIFKYNLFSFRLLSLIFGCMSIILFYSFLKFVFCKKEREGMEAYPMLGTALLSQDIQFIYASHFARQEIILIFCIIFAAYSLLKNKTVLAAVITGLAIGIHPNSFIIGTMCLAILTPMGNDKAIAQNRWAKWKPIALYTLITGAFAAFYISISLFMDKRFIQHYMDYGNSEFDVGAPLTNKISEFPYFIEKIWYGVSGTYYVPNIKLELVIFLATLILAIIYLLLSKRTNGHLALSNSINNIAEMIFIIKGLIGIVAGMIIIGRYNQTGIVFIFPLIFMLVLLVADSGCSIAAPGRAWQRNLIVVVLIFCLAISSYINIKPWLNYSYNNYISEISKTVEPSDKVLANLNCEYYFDNGKLLDYRNLSYLKENNETIEEYVKNNDIEYIILSDEMDFIYSQRPVWNIIYGNLRYMDELNAFTQYKCELVDVFINNTYGIRIVQYMNSDRDFMVKIFKVKDFI